MKYEKVENGNKPKKGDIRIWERGNGEFNLWLKTEGGKLLYFKGRKLIIYGSENIDDFGHNVFRKSSK